MNNDLDGPKESSEKVAERKWRNNALRQKYKENKMPVVAIVDPADIDYVNKKIHLDKSPPPEVATVIENTNKRSVQSLERKFLKEVRAILDERKQENLRIVEAYACHIRQERRKLMLEKIRRLELRIAEREKAKEIGHKDLFA